MEILKHVNDKSDFTQVFSACAGAVTTVQYRCADAVVKDRDWRIDFEEGKIYFGQDGFEFYFVGSESSKSDTWLWGYKNVNNFSDQIVSLARDVLKIGEELGLEAITTPSFEIDETYNGLTMSVLACALSGQNLFYYRCPHEGGCAYVAVKGAPSEVFRAPDAEEFVKIATNCIGCFELDHKIFVESFLDFAGVTYERSESKGGWFKKASGKIVAKFGKELTISFDEKERVTNLEI